jgi:hypothetical protein
MPLDKLRLKLVREGFVGTDRTPDLDKPPKFTHGIMIGRVIGLCCGDPFVQPFGLLAF